MSSLGMESNSDSLDDEEKSKASQSSLMRRTDKSAVESKHVPHALKMSEIRKAKKNKKKTRDPP